MQRRRERKNEGGRKGRQCIKGRGRRTVRARQEDGCENGETGEGCEMGRLEV